MIAKRQQILLLLTLLVLLKPTLSTARRKRPSGGGGGGGGGGEGQQQQQHRQQKQQRREPKEQDYYSILGLSKNAKPKDIKSAYRKLALQFHPDKVPDEEKEEAEDKFIQVSEAYAVLSDVEKRKIYDKYGKIGLQAHERGADPSQFGADGGNVFGQGFGGNGGNFQFTFNPRPGGMGGMGGGPGGFDPFMMFEQMFGGSSGGAGGSFEGPGFSGKLKNLFVAVLTVPSPVSGRLVPRRHRSD